MVTFELLVWAVGLGVAIPALAVRTVVHLGRTPGGVDTWYYLAYAAAFRRRPSLDVRLPPYLHQDARPSYPPLFPSLLALFPQRWLERWYWLVSPVVDCVHLGLLYGVTFRLTGSVAVGVIAASTYAFTPHLISETRSLTGRPFGALLHTVSVLALFKWLASGEWRWSLVALLVAALLFLSSAALSAAYAFVCVSLTIAFADLRYAACALVALVLAFTLSMGHMAHVVQNYMHAVAYWRRNRRRYGAHPVRNSPLYGNLPLTAARHPGFLGRSLLEEHLRLLGENPFLLALPLVGYGHGAWSQRLYAWAVALVLLTVVATVAPPIRAFGPARSYMKAAIFPTAFSLAYGLGGTRGLLKPLGMVVLACLAASLTAILFFVVYVRRRPTEQTASLPDGLREVASTLRAMPSGSVFVLPYMYADIVCYRSNKPVLWGGHCGDHCRFEWVAPVISRPLPDLFREFGVRYLLLDNRYVRVAELCLGGQLGLARECQGFELYEYYGEAAARPAGPPERIGAG